MDQEGPRMGVVDHGVPAEPSGDWRSSSGRRSPGAPLRVRSRAHVTESSSTRAAYALAAMTGNVGVPGGNSGTSNRRDGRYGITRCPSERTGEARVRRRCLADLLERGRAGGYPPTSR